jgi:cell wall-associated NlpC family hydrolase
VLAIAARYEGLPYKYGGTTPDGFDCSGFTSHVMARMGIDLPRTSGAQRSATWCSCRGTSASTPATG